VAASSTAIAKQLAAARVPQDAFDCLNLIPARRAEISARLYDISPQPTGGVFQIPTARREAEARGVDALKALDEEREGLWREESHLVALERNAYEAAERLRISALREAYVPAVQAIPRHIASVRRHLAALDKEISQINATVEVIASFSEIGESFPFSDDELSELYTLRDELWETRTIKTLVIAGDQEDRKKFPKTWPRAFWVRGQPDNFTTCFSAPPPRRVNLMDYMSADAGTSTIDDRQAGIRR
jgi:hypothetical protein